MFFLGEKLHPAVNVRSRPWNNEQLITYWRPRVSQMFLLGEKLHPVVNVMSRSWNNEQLITYWRSRVSQMFLLGEKLYPAVNVRSRSWNNEQLITYWRSRVSQMFLLGEKLNPAVKFMLAVGAYSWRHLFTFPWSVSKPVDPSVVILQFSILANAVVRQKIQNVIHADVGLGTYTCRSICICYDCVLSE